LPKTTRGRRPAPNPKKRTQHHITRPSPLDDTGAASLASTTGVAEPSPSGRPTAPPARPAATGTSLRRMPHATPRRRFIDSVAEYAYVGSDLRRIGMVAGGLVILLVALSFVIR